jgi:thiosulfate dehydrogenase
MTPGAMIMTSNEPFTTSIVRRPLSILVAAIVLAAAFIMTPAAGVADEVESSLARGGKLYDKWYKVIGVDAPLQSHPAYPADKKYAAKPKSNWRCKECHGWDYMGRDGAYSKGKHHTGIKGINGMRGADPAKIIAVLKGQSHQYGDKMEAADLQDLANFVSNGQINMDDYIDRASKMAKGDKNKGAAYFNTVCAGCHSKAGTKPKDMEKTLGAQMGNPWEVMHKIMNGQPDEPMPALRALDRQVVLDIMAHMTTLPKER